MSLPRQILPKQFYLLTRRCTQQLFLMRPDEATNNAFIYCLVVAAIKFAIDILMTDAESNHHHTVAFDRYGNISQFMEYFHRLFARSQNVLRGRAENFWSTVEPSVVRLLDRDAVIDKLVYTASNPVNDGLVERVHHWPGVNSYSNFVSGRPLRATRPRHFFRKKSSLPTEVTLPLVIPPELGSRDEIIEAVREGVKRVEATKRDERLATGARVVGRRAVLKTSWKTSSNSSLKASAISERPQPTFRPRFAGAAAARQAAVAEYRAFLWAYRQARKKWLETGHADFPEGTYWLARFARTALVCAHAGPDLTPGVSAPLVSGVAIATN